tara:strand:+ start:84956 stop:85114 length:159 start_codon:yes stop_codon:yes gene_type:complete
VTALPWLGKPSASAVPPRSGSTANWCPCRVARPRRAASRRFSTSRPARKASR